MVTRIATYNTPDDFKRVAATIVNSNGRNKGLMQEALVASFAHAEAHGDWVNSIAPLLTASQSFGKNLQTACRVYVETHSKLNFNPNNLIGRALNDKPVTELWAWNSKKEPKPIEAGKHWYDAKATPKSTKDEPVMVAAVLGRVRSTLQTAINTNLARGADNKMVTLATVQKMLRDMADGLEYKPVTGAIKVDTVVDDKAKATDDKRIAVAKKKVEAKAKAKVAPEAAIAKAA